MPNETIQVAANLDIGRSTAQVNSGLSELSRRIKTLELGVNLNIDRFSDSISAAAKELNQVTQTLGAIAASFKEVTANLKQAMHSGSSTRSSNVGWPKTTGEKMQYAYLSKEAA